MTYTVKARRYAWAMAVCGAILLVCLVGIRYSVRSRSRSLFTSVTALASLVGLVHSICLLDFEVSECEE